MNLFCPAKPQLTAFTLIIALFCVTIFAQKNVAVLEIERRANVVNEISREEAMEITNAMRSAAVRALPRARYSVMTSETVQSMSGAVLADCADESCIITIGRRIDADYIVRGTLSKFQTRFTLHIEMYETDYGNLIATADPIRSENLNDILEKTGPACVDMYIEFLDTGTQTAATPPPMPVPIAPQAVSRPEPQPLPPPPTRYEPAVRATASNISYGSFTDSRDGQTYRTVTIGNQTWMAQNLNYRNPSWARNDVTRRVRVKDKGSWCYVNNADNCNTYGRLYTWNAAMEACPIGWRLPSDDDWTALVNAIGGTSTAGTRLKSSTGWRPHSSTPIGTDEYGFSALPGGNRWSGGRFNNVGDYGYWWTTAEDGATRARYRIMDYYYEYVNSLWVKKSNGFSVRCLRD